MPKQNPQKRDVTPGDRPPRRRLASAAKTTLLSCLLAGVLLAGSELLLALYGVDPVSLHEDPYVGFSSQFPLFVERTESDGHTFMATAANKLDLFNHQEFAIPKPAGVFRIFCLGGSTTYGRPYDDTTSFCGWLRVMLPKADPSRQWEVINAGGISYASYRITRLMEELARYQPDLFIVYTGHNEFLEERTYRPLTATPALLRETHALLARTRLYAASKNLRATAPHKEKPEGNSPPMLPGEVTAILDQTIGPASYHRDDALRDQALNHFRFNLNRIVDTARDAGARILLITPASNLRDCTPFKSQHSSGLIPEERRDWRAFFAQGRKAHGSADYESAERHLRQAEAIDPRHAHQQHLLGQTLWELGRYGEATAAFVRARDEDVCPLRALTPMRRIVEDTALATGAPLVDFAAWAEERAPHGTPGDELFLDHVHPTIETNRQLALMLLDAMTQHGIVARHDSWNESAIAAVKREVEARLDDEAHAAALRNLAKVLGWAGKFEEALNLATRSTRMNPEDAEAHYHRAENAAQLGRTDVAIEACREALRIRPDFALANLRLGNCLSEKGESEEAIRHYTQLLSAGPKYAALAHNNIGNERQAQGNLDEAIHHYRESVKLNPDYAEAHSNWGLALAARGDSAQAAAHHREALAIEPDNTVAHFNLGLALSAQGLYADSLPHFRHTIRHMPDYAPAHYHLGESLAKAGRMQEAIDAYLESLRLQPNYVAALADLARLLATCPQPHLRDPERAVRLATRACQLTEFGDTASIEALAIARQAARQPDGTSQEPLSDAGKE